MTQNYTPVQIGDEDLNQKALEAIQWSMSRSINERELYLRINRPPSEGTTRCLFLHSFEIVSLDKPSCIPIHHQALEACW